jgi:hypothetical protein
LLCKNDGWAVGIFANQRNVSKTKKGETQFVIYSEILQIKPHVLLPIAIKRNTLGLSSRCYWIYGWKQI